MATVYIVERCDNFYEVRDTVTNKVVAGMDRLAFRISAKDLAEKFELNLVNKEG